ncbi:MAG TPA: Gfo/Idh/MocA family oxidoreductase, partial [Methylomirabilota bacterium]|nr:Gfo/Idh/MocA family oxidoreductase [Methylomirabilota bacterium]
VAEQQGRRPKAVSDMREVFDDRAVDTVSIATPNHWHALAAIWAMQAGKDVYVEKPVSHNVWEGRQIVEAARKYNRIVQTGTQCRSNLGEPIQYVHDGKLGKIKLARGLCYKPRRSIGDVQSPQPVPDSVDYDLWIGPAEKLPLMRERLHYDWHWVWNTGNGDVGNQGIHQMDIARWALNVDHLSPRVLSVGGRLGYTDDGETPNTQFVCHDYDVAPLIFEVRGLDTDAYKGAKIGVIIEGEHGTMVIDSYTHAAVFDHDNKQVVEFRHSSSHHANFINAVRSRKPSDLTADIIEGHLSSALCHCGNISHLVGSDQSPDAIREALKSDNEAMETYERMAEHLAANKVDLKKTPLTLGAVLKMDPKTERFIGNDKANALLSRNYRKPFVVPAKV